MAKPTAPIDINRREFTQHSLLALLAGVTITVSGCGDDDESPTGPVTDETGAISNNHGHAATITAAQLMAGDALALTIQGTASHDHTVSLTAAEIDQIRNGARVVKTSSTTDSHQHEVTFN
jgi:hypothetical protein